MCARLAEGHGHRGAGVADGLGELLPAVQVAQRDVVDPVEDPRVAPSPRRRR